MRFFFSPFLLPFRHSLPFVFFFYGIITLPCQVEEFFLPYVRFAKQYSFFSSFCAIVNGYFCRWTIWSSIHFVTPSFSNGKRKKTAKITLPSCLLLNWGSWFIFHLFVTFFVHYIQLYGWLVGRTVCVPVCLSFSPFQIPNISWTPWIMIEFHLYLDSL